MNPLRQSDSTRPVRVRLVVWLSTVLSALLLAGSVSDYRTSIRPVLDAFDVSLSDSALGLVGYLNTDGPRPTFVLPVRAQRLLQTDARDTILYRVTDPEGVTLAGDEALPAAAPSAGRLFYDATVRGRPLRIFSQPIATSLGTCQIIVAETTLKREDARRHALLTRALSDSLVLIVTLALVWFIVGFAMRPLERLAQQVKTRAGDDLRPLSLAGVAGEARPLVTALNRLFVRIGDTQQSQRRFIENAAHQLRTPLAALKGQSELALADARGKLGGGDPLVERLDRVQQAANHLTHLANQLLTLSRSDRSTHDSAQRRAVHLPALVDEAVSAMLDAALDRQQDLGAETQPCQFEGVAWELRELLTNLIDNAIRYTPPGSRITVRCGPSPEGVYLEVEDDGIGIPVAERDRVFERFYRLPGSAPGGSGLGLAIVREIVGLYGGSVMLLDPATGSGLRVRASFPVLPAVPIRSSSAAVPADAA